MKKAKRVCKNYEFTSIIQHRTFVKSSSFVCYFEARKCEHARVGISVGKKLGNAVVRNTKPLTQLLLCDLVIISNPLKKISMN
mgnify:CR=1 FL=1